MTYTANHCYRRLAGRPSGRADMPADCGYDPGMGSEEEEQPVAEAVDGASEDDLEQAAAPDDPEAPGIEASIADGERHRLDPASVAVARMTGRIVSASFFSSTLFVLVLLTFLVPLSGALPVVLFSVWLVLLAAGVALVEIWPGIRYRHIWYRVDDNGMAIWRGVVWRQVTSVPRTRVQHIDVIQGPLQRGFDLASLVMHTAGTQDASVSLSGLSHSTALRIRDFLIEEQVLDGG